MPMEEQVREIPGVTAAGFSEQGALLGYGGAVYLPLVGQPPDPPDRQRTSESRGVMPGYYAALGTPILKGRNFNAQDTPTSQPVAIVNQTWVREFLPKGLDPVGQAFREGDGSKVVIVGVVADARQNALEPARPEIDFPISRESLQEQQNTGSWSLYLYVRTAVPSLSIIPQLRKALRDVGPAIAFQHDGRPAERCLSQQPHGELGIWNLRQHRGLARRSRYIRFVDSGSHQPHEGYWCANGSWRNAYRDHSDDVCAYFLVAGHRTREWTAYDFGPPSSCWQHRNDPA
jgi:hypothetical protein